MCTRACCVYVCVVCMHVYACMCACMHVCVCMCDDVHMTLTQAVQYASSFVLSIVAVQLVQSVVDVHQPVTLPVTSCDQHLRFPLQPRPAQEQTVVVVVVVEVTIVVVVVVVEVTIVVVVVVVEVTIVVVVVVVVVEVTIVVVVVVVVEVPIVVVVVVVEVTIVVVVVVVVFIILLLQTNPCPQPPYGRSFWSTPGLLYT